MNEEENQRAKAFCEIFSAFFILMHNHIVAVVFVVVVVVVVNVHIVVVVFVVDVVVFVVVVVVVNVEMVEMIHLNIVCSCSTSFYICYICK